VASCGLDLKKIFSIWLGGFGPMGSWQGHVFW